MVPQFMALIPKKWSPIRLLGFVLLLGILAGMVILPDLVQPAPEPHECSKTSCPFP